VNSHPVPFWAFGFFLCKSCSLIVGEIDPRSLRPIFRLYVLQLQRILWSLWIQIPWVLIDWFCWLLMMLKLKFNIMNMIAMFIQVFFILLIDVVVWVSIFGRLLIWLIFPPTGKSTLFDKLQLFTLRSKFDQINWLN